MGDSVPPLSIRSTGEKMVGLVAEKGTFWLRNKLNVSRVRGLVFTERGDGFFWKFEGTGDTADRATLTAPRTELLELTESKESDDEEVDMEEEPGSLNLSESQVISSASGRKKSQLSRKSFGLVNEVCMFIKEM
jgi:hypothetical protein